MFAVKVLWKSSRGKSKGTGGRAKACETPDHTVQLAGSRETPDHRVQLAGSLEDCLEVFSSYA